MVTHIKCKTFAIMARSIKQPLALNHGILMILFILFGGYESATGQDVALDDYKIFGRKAPMTLGSSFSSLGEFRPFINPANLALVVDNSIAFSFSTSGHGFGNDISFIGPNFSISSARQDQADGQDSVLHSKQLLTFAYGLSFGNPYPPDSRAFAVGIAVNRKSDEKGTGISQALTADLGLIFKMGKSYVNLTALDVELSTDSTNNSKGYPMRFIVGYRTKTKFGLRVALQGLPGIGYGKEEESNFGLRFGLGQSLFNNRLDSRLQLTSIFDNSGKATMQEITAGVGFRRNPQRAKVGLRMLLDVEFGYALSFLAVPNIIGTHMLTLVKYF